MIAKNAMTTIASSDFLSIEVPMNPESVLVRFQVYDKSSCSVQHLCGDQLYCKNRSHAKAAARAGSQAPV